MSFISILIGLGIFALILISALLVLVVLMQRAKSDGGVAAMGGGVAEATFGAETGNVLSKSTIYLAVAFFVLSFLVYLGQLYQHKHAAKPAGGELPTITAPAAPTAPAAELPALNTTAPAAPSPAPEAAK